MTLPNLSIIGCGYLGKIVLKHFKKTSLFAHIYASYHHHKDQEVEVLANGYYQLSRAPSSFFDSDYIFIFISPRGNYKNYSSTISSILKLIPKGKRIILTSSSSVYPREPGVYCEKSPINPDKESSAFYLRDVENAVINFNEHSSVIRLTGLFDDQRHPARSLSKKGSVTQGRAPVNLIHTHDVPSFLENLLKEKKIYQEINLVSPIHPSKKDFYTKECQRLNLEVPKFEESGNDRIIKSDIVGVEIPFNFEFSNPRLLLSEDIST